MTEVAKSEKQTAERATPAGEPEVPVYTPETDILETETRYVLLVDMPGVSESGIEVSVEDNELTISGRGLSAARPDHRLLYNGYVPGDYRRVFRLGARLDREGITARLQHGVLRIELPKAREALPRKINVTAA